MKIIKKYSFPAPVSAFAAKYPWDEYLDGAIREFSPEDLDGVDLKTFRSMAKDRAGKRGKSASTAGSSTLVTPARLGDDSTTTIVPAARSPSLWNFRLRIMLASPGTNARGKPSTARRRLRSTA